MTGRTADFLVADALTREFRESLGTELSVVLHFRDTIPQEPNGRYRFAICRVPGVRGRDVR